MNRFNRRRFLQASALGTAALGLPALSYAQVPNANSDIRVGIAGLRGRGADHIRGFGAIPGVRIAGLCDCDSSALQAAAARCKDLGHTAATCADVRKLLEEKNMDVVSTATPNHWHSLIVVWACQAGKDVYVEKPVSHNVWEGRKAVEAARKYERIVQAGTQSRSRAGHAAGGRLGAGRQPRQDPTGRAASATSGAPASARSTARSPSRRTWTTICGAGRRRRSR